MPPRSMTPSRRPAGSKMVDVFHGVSVADPTGGWRTATPPRSEPGSPPRTAHPPGARRPPRSGVVARAPRRVDASPAGPGRGRAGPAPCSRWSGRPTPSSSSSSAARPTTPDGAGRPVDPAGAAADAAVAVDWFHPSTDGALVAIGPSEGGTEHSVLRVLDGRAGAPGEAIADTRACSVAWEPDGRDSSTPAIQRATSTTARPSPPSRRPTGVTTRWSGTTPDRRRGRTCRLRRRPLAAGPRSSAGSHRRPPARPPDRVRGRR